MRSFLLMLSFFTRLPVKHIAYEEKTYIRGIKYAPVIGLLMGLILYGLSFLSLILDRPVVTIILIFSYIILTGALHLDGLADTCDGVFSGRSRERILEIMRDSQTGAYGVISIGLWFVFYVVLLNYVPYQALIILPVVGKSAPIISASVGHYIRQEGLGKVFAEHAKGPALVVAILLPLLISLLLNLYFIGAVGLAFLAVLVATKQFERTIGGITGDTMGFVCELSQMVFIFAVYMINIITNIIINIIII